MELNIVTPQRQLTRVPETSISLPADVSSVIVPGEEGQFEVLPGHSPFLTMLGTGLLTFTTGGKDVHLMVSKGFCEVDRDKVSVMCEEFALASEVDKAGEEAAHTRLQQELAALGPVSADDESFQQKKAEVERAATKLMLK